MVRRTDFSKTLIDVQTFEKLHAPTIGDVHLRPFCRVEIPLDQHASDTMCRELQCCDEP